MNAPLVPHFHVSLPALCRHILIAAVLALTGAPTMAADVEPTLPHFDIFEYDVEGNTRLSDQDIEHAVTPFLGEDKTLRDVDLARAALEKAYHDAGYLTVVVSIPEQKVDAGAVVLSVLEGRVDRLRIKGAEYHLSSAIKARMPELAQGGIPYFPKVQSDLDVLNRSPDLKATPVLKAGRTPGTVDITLEVDDQLPLHGNLELNDRQSPGTRPLRLSGSVRYDNLWQLGHSIGLFAQTAPEAVDQSKVLSANYAVPLNTQGNSLVLYAVHASSNVPGPTSLLSNSDIAGLRLALPLPGTSDYYHSLSLGLDYKNIHRVEALVGNSVSTQLQPAIAYVPLIATYNGVTSDSGSSTAADSTLVLGVRGILGNRDEDFAAKRPGLSAQYASLRMGLKHTESFQRWSASGRIEIQLATGMLLPNEQYAAGGVDSVRGYLESEQTGDRAYRFSLEVRTPSVQLGSGNWPLRLTGIGFFDAARLTSLQFDPSRSSALPSINYTLRGTGVGLRMSGPKGLSFDIDLATALNDGGPGSNNTKAGNYRVHSRLIWEFL